MTAVWAQSDAYLGHGHADEDAEELQLDLDEATDEVAELRAEMRAAAIESQQLQMRLKAAASHAASQGSPGVLGPTPMPVACPLQEQRCEELRRLLTFLAEHADLQRPQILDVGFEVPIGGRKVHLQRVVQWTLPSVAGGRLRITAPIEHEGPFGNLLATTKATGQVSPYAINGFVSSWDLVAGELTTAAHAYPEPSVLLAHRGSTQGIMVATWPTREALEAFHSLCSGPHGDVPLRLGDRVEVEFEERWYVGVLHGVDSSGKASVRCDVDAPGVMTVTPLCKLRRLVGCPVAAAAAAAAVAAAVGAAADESPGRRRRIFSDQAPSVRGFSPGSEDKKQPGHRRTRSSAL